MVRRIHCLAKSKIKPESYLFFPILNNKSGYSVLLANQKLKDFLLGMGNDSKKIFVLTKSPLYPGIV